MSRSQLVQYKNLLDKEARLKKANGMAYYQPHPKQDAFHRAGARKRRYVRTGNRFGKSACGAGEDCAWAVGERSWYAKGDPGRYAGIPKRSTKGLILVADWDKAKEIFTNDVDGQGIGKLFELLPQSRIKKKVRNQSGVIAEIHIESIWGGISTIHMDTIKSFKSNSMGQESSDWDWIHVDEPIPKDMWTANSRGLIDRSGSAWFTCTPLNQAWINDMFVPSRRTRIELDKPLEKDEQHWMITGSSYDNPHLTKEALALFEADLTEAEKQCRISGIPLALSGLVYKQFDHNVHVYDKTPHGWEAMDKPPANYTVRVSIDPHPKTPHAVLFAATAPSGETYFYSETFRQILIDDLSENINEKTLGYHVHQYLCDPAAFIEHPTDGSSMADKFFENGIAVDKAPKDLARGIVEVQAKLAERKKTPGGMEIPVVFFSDELAETTYEFDHYEWDSKKDNKPVDKDDHMMECLYRLVITGLEYIPYLTDDTAPVRRRFGDTSTVPHYGKKPLPKIKSNRYG